MPRFHCLDRGRNRQIGAVEVPSHGGALQRIANFDRMKKMGISQRRQLREKKQSELTSTSAGRRLSALWPDFRKDEGAQQKQQIWEKEKEQEELISVDGLSKKPSPSKPNLFSL
ncbi:hypothetical protein ACLOJK_012087 [Asimina triloba]